MTNGLQLAKCLAPGRSMLMPSLVPHVVRPSRIRSSGRVGGGDLAGVVELTTNAVVSRTAVALTLFAVAFYMRSHLGSIAFPSAKGPLPPS